MKKILTVMLCLGFSVSTFADLLTWSGQYAIELEEDAAAANQAIYDELLALGCPDTSLDIAGQDCSSSFTLMVWEKVRELVHTANDICDPLDNCGATEFSLQINLEGLGNVLRWHSAEEFSTQEDMADSFLGGQLTNLQTRVSAIRSGATGFNISGTPQKNSDEWITSYRAEQAGLSSGDKTPVWSPWGGFLNMSYNWGSHDPTDREAAYDSDGTGVNGGFDYRLNDTWVIGTTVAVQMDRIDFDSEKSVVDGKVDMTAYSLIPFLLYQAPEWFFLTSIGFQQADFETERAIRYNSGNPNLPDTNTRADSKNNANIYSASVSGGYTWYIPAHPAFSIEPSLRLDYQDTNIDAFEEKDINNDNFNLLVDEQHFDSLESTLALRLQYVFSSAIGVIVPFMDFAHHTQHKTDPHIIEATYVNATYDFSNASLFQFESSPVEKEYQTYTIGASFILRGAQQKTLDGPATGGLQGFISASIVDNIDFYEQNTVAGGLRYEF
jgi:hypothetical protein